MPAETTTMKALSVAYRAGEKIAAAGERGACMFVVQSGSVRLQRPGGAGAPRTIATLEKGDFFGEAALLEGHAYGVDAEALTDCEVVEIGPSAFHRILRSQPEIAVRMLRKLAQRVERLEAQAADAPGPATAPAAPEPARAPRPAAPPRGRSSRLVLEGGETVFPLEGDEVLIGRYDPVTEIQPEIDLTAADDKRSVSRRHARITRRNGGWYIAEEVGALNGTFVNGIRLLPGRGAPLNPGDVVSVGMVRLVYVEGGPA
ncbi:MAG: cyclic nucleotide-binding domain-containing protein [Acidobacteria bacterium]|nr:cyclic nucleotide-binding domain-containing protein [Acidobacteriota bacterium]